MSADEVQKKTNGWVTVDLINRKGVHYILTKCRQLTGAKRNFDLPLIEMLALV